jgi:hypothetical protein
MRRLLVIADVCDNQTSCARCVSQNAPDSIGHGCHMLCKICT